MMILKRWKMLTPFDDGTKEPLFGFGARYDFDSVLVYDANGAFIYPGPVLGNGEVDLSPYRRSDAIIPLEKDTTEYYYLHLRDQGLDIDKTTGQSSTTAQKKNLPN
jgi:hypothetical protein